MARLRRLSTRDRAALVFGVTAVALILLVGRAFPAVRSRVAFEAEAMTTTARHLTVMRALVVDSQRLRMDAEAMSRVRSSAELLLSDAGSPAAAAAALAAHVERLGSVERVRLGSSVTLGDTAFAGGYARVGVRVYATADLPGLVRWLDRLEREPSGYAIRELTVTQSDPAAEDRVADAFTVELLVEALVRDREGGGRR